MWGVTKGWEIKQRRCKCTEQEREAEEEEWREGERRREIVVQLMIVGGVSSLFRCLVSLLALPVAAGLPQALCC